MCVCVCVRTWLYFIAINSVFGGGPCSSGGPSRAHPPLLSVSWGRTVDWLVQLPFFWTPVSLCCVGRDPLTFMLLDSDLLFSSVHWWITVWKGFCAALDFRMKWFWCESVMSCRTCVMWTCPLFEPASVLHHVLSSLVDGCCWWWWWWWFPCVTGGRSLSEWRMDSERWSDTLVWCISANPVV